MEPLGVYTRYSRLGASSRYRYYLYEPAFRAAGYAPRFHPFFRDAYLQRLYRDGAKSRLDGALSLMRRGGEALVAPRRLLIEYELLPMIACRWEKLLIGNRDYVLNFDDDVWLKYRDLPRLADKYDRLVAGARGVIAANDVLLEKVGRLNSNVLKIPTCVDLDDYPWPVKDAEADVDHGGDQGADSDAVNDASAGEGRENGKFPVFTVVWIGTPVTYPYLEAHAEHLREMARRVDFELLVIAAEHLRSRAIPGVRMRFVDWSQQLEAVLLARSHVGIMPLPADDAFAAGKSAFKLIQYLAAGIPAIASPVGENLKVLQPGRTGFPATRPDEWAEALIQLTDEARREAMAANCRRLAHEFSIQKYGPVYTDFLQRCYGDA